MLENRELAGHLDHLLQRLTVSTQRQKSDFAEKLGISRQQFEVLTIIFEKGQITMGELCKEISSACSTATDLADKLERAGYVERIREKRDRRIVRLNILPKGEKLVKSVIETRTERLESILESFEQEDGMRIIGILETLSDKYERLSRKE
ncbi:MarR family transcriptional regulator [Dehalobacter sp. 14DCB1]|uniref:MarR family winged helix-turn-helix transcriptional regulator n=1 Tax=Dehalobacter sp. 14DCB1 TaxID=2070227 RepID=UPI000379427D|nr:MarR family transcriptional regulator [Dehalobacter sp. 14DCB1]TCX53860.1 MarR family transcriptional regulator [Dehalobacter sp. 14DCB1]